MKSRYRRIGSVAKLAGISVRTLRYYEQRGLLTPAARSSKGYRLYAEEDLLRLQQVLIHRRLGLSLERIVEVLASPSLDYRTLLEQQCVRLTGEMDRLATMKRAIEATLASMARKGGGFVMTEETFAGMGAEEAVEAERRWGQTAAYKESARRTANYGAEQWRTIEREQDDIFRAAADAARRSLDPGCAEARELVDRHRRFIDGWFYPCAPAMHVGLADLFDGDARFTARMDIHGAGAARFLAAAIRDCYAADRNV
jgi:MerR family transcriptional regulator, thiopeptide resistance regulator